MRKKRARTNGKIRIVTNEREWEREGASSFGRYCAIPGRQLMLLTALSSPRVSSMMKKMMDQAKEPGRVAMASG